MDMRPSGLKRGAATLKRRGLVAGGMALLGAGLARLGTTDQVRAAHDSPPSDETIIHAGASNTTSATTFVSANLPNVPSFVAFNGGGATTYVGSKDGLQGVTNANSDGAAGVRGQAESGGGAVFGVVGTTNSSTTNASGVRGVAGLNNGLTNGVWGETTSTASSSDGVFGLASAVAAQGAGATVGVWGRSNSSHAGAVGTYGEITAAGAAGTGVKGVSTNGVGVQGSSNSGIGVFGFSAGQIGVRGDSVNNYGVYGTSSLTALRGEASGGGVGFVGIALNPGAGGLAGAFFGGVTVQGAFTQSGGPKSAAVPHPDGSHRRMYCQESTEAWFEDFGTATLTNGRVVVDLDPDFDAVVKGDDYMVFPVAEGACSGLYISRKGPHRFVVEECNNGKSTVPFSYRVVSRRRENVGARMEKVDVKGPPTPKSPPQKVGPDGRLER